MQEATAIFGGGCFWCTEAIFRRLKGVASVTPGYTGGTIPNPTYAQVSRGDTGHVEAIRITFNPSVISYDDLLTVFFATHDPTTPNQQGADVGTQYRSAIFAVDDSQSQAARAFIERLNRSTHEGAPIVTSVLPAGMFYPAEEEHREYYERNATAPYCQIVINPKLQKLQDEFERLLR